MDGVDIAVTHVDADGLHCEAILLARSVNDDWRLYFAGTEGQVPAGGGVTRGGV